MKDTFQYLIPDSKFYISPLSFSVSLFVCVCFLLVLSSCGKIFLQMRVSWMIGCKIRVSLGEFSDSTLDEFITGRLINCKSRFLHFPSTCSHRWSKCQGFSSNNIFELPCLSVSSPLPLHFFLPISAYSSQTCWLLALASGIHLKCSSSPICLLWVSDF